MKNNNLSKSAEKVMSLPPSKHVVILGRAKKSNSPGTKAYRKKKRELVQSKNDRKEIVDDLYQYMIYENGYTFWEQKSDGWRELNHKEIMDKMTKDVRMMIARKIRGDFATSKKHKCTDTEFLITKFLGYLQVLHSKLHSKLQAEDCEASKEPLPEIGEVMFGQHVPPESFTGNMLLLALVSASKLHYDKQDNTGKNACVNIIIDLMKHYGAEFVSKEGYVGDRRIYQKIRQRLTKPPKITINLDQAIANFLERQANAASQGAHGRTHTYSQSIEGSQLVDMDPQVYEELYQWFISFKPIDKVGFWEQLDDM